MRSRVVTRGTIPLPDPKKARHLACTKYHIFHFFLPPSPPSQLSNICQKWGWGVQVNYIITECQQPKNCVKHTILLAALYMSTNFGEKNTINCHFISLLSRWHRNNKSSFLCSSAHAQELTDPRPSSIIQKFPELSKRHTQN